MRINKFLAECGAASRRGADELIESGKVSVNGKRITEPGVDINVDNDCVLVDGQRIKPVARYTYIMLNKPKGCICSSSDEKGRRTVYDYLKGIEIKLSTVGRLDYDSEGLLLLTNDGELVNKLTHPSNEIPKTYIVKAEGSLREDELASLRKGVKLLDGAKTARAKVKLLEFREGLSRLEMVLFEGKNREIRRMFEAIGRKVVFLKRKAVAELELGGLARGAFRYLTENEIHYLKNKI